ncbi:hypothetical protein [Stutzerimonas nitrititolerans]|uniref:hypothetical protein n=1 Tax=Stutzerimonas nitrititolerans TaxID=2482751 RepID=UPI0028AAE030|nr:hypothetical protein [Stutzerimonas nitrititolerans]
MSTETIDTSTVEHIIQALSEPPAPAAEVVTLNRPMAERILAWLEDHPAIAGIALSTCEEVSVLRQALAEPKVELWAIHSVGPGEVYPCLSKEHAEREAKELFEQGEKMKADRIARGESVEHWHDWVANVIPSPWEPAEHFEILAGEIAEHRDDLLAHVKKLDETANSDHTPQSEPAPAQDGRDQLAAEAAYYRSTLRNVLKDIRDDLARGGLAPSWHGVAETISIVIGSDRLAQAEPLHITHRPLIRNAINLLGMRRPVAPDVQRVIDDLEAMLGGQSTPAGAPSEEWLQVATLAEPAPAQDDREIAELIDQRDNAEDWANKLSAAIASHTGAYIGEHSNMNCPWANALEAIENTRPAQTEQQPATPCDHQWTDDGLHLLVCTSCGAQEDHDPGWQDMATAPRDGTLVQLLVEFDEHATEDTDGPAPTIGANNYDNDGEDRWQFAGWCWSHDHFTEGHGTPVGWLPIAAPIAQTAPQPEQSGLVTALEYYANGDHLLLADPDEWDTCSGEPANFLHDEAGTASVEDGSIAKVALEAYRTALSAQGGRDD